MAASLRAHSETQMLASGPIESRRFGLSVDINLLGSVKICSFDCGYCDLGQTQTRMNQLKDDQMFPKLQSIEDQLRQVLRLCRDQQKAIQSLTVAGNGEPTLHPLFAESVEMLHAVRSDLFPESRIVVLTNGAHCDSRKVIQGLNLADERVVKVDAGGDSKFKQVNRPLVRATISKIASNARKLKDVTTQTMFVQGSADNTRIEDIEEWLEVLGIIQPKQIQIYTINRFPSDSEVKAVDEDTLYTIASRVKRRLQVDCLVFP